MSKDSNSSFENDKTLKNSESQGSQGSFSTSFLNSSSEGRSQSVGDISSDNNDSIKINQNLSTKKIVTKLKTPVKENVKNQSQICPVQYIEERQYYEELENEIKVLNKKRYKQQEQVNKYQNKLERLNYKISKQLFKDVDFENKKRIKLQEEINRENISLKSIQHQMTSLKQQLSKVVETKGKSKLEIEEEIRQLEKYKSLKLCHGLTIQQINQIPDLKYGIQIPLNEEDVCTVCFSELQKNEKVKNLSCNHKYHSECIRDWLLRKKRCPICNQEVQI